MHVGVPVAPISSAYSLLSKDYDKLWYALGLLKPGLVFVASGAPLAAALRKVGLGEAELVCGSDPPEGMRATEFRELLETQTTSAVDEAYARVGPDTVAKILFSSGSTDLPKGVINTQRMLCSNQQAIAQVWPFLSEKPPVLVDWLPWNHTFGGNFCFNMMLRHGGTLYVDEGKPTPQLITKTVANLHEISPTLYFNVPRGFDMLPAISRARRSAPRQFFSAARFDLLCRRGATAEPLGAAGKCRHRRHR
jgi:feruloyl-CoA synthase